MFKNLPKVMGTTSRGTSDEHQCRFS